MTLFSWPPLRVWAREGRRSKSFFCLLYAEAHKFFSRGPAILPGRGRDNVIVLSCCHFVKRETILQQLHAVYRFKFQPRKVFVKLLIADHSSPFLKSTHENFRFLGLEYRDKLSILFTIMVGYLTYKPI